MPTLEQWQGLARAILAVFSGLLLSKGMSQGTYEAFVGFAGLSVNVIWSFTTHGLTKDLITSFLRAGIGAFGGFAVDRGWMSSDVVNQITTVVAIISPMVWTIFVHKPEIADPTDTPSA